MTPLFLCALYKCPLKNHAKATQSKVITEICIYSSSHTKRVWNWSLKQVNLSPLQLSFIFQLRPPRYVLFYMPYSVFVNLKYSWDLSLILVMDIFSNIQLYVQEGKIRSTIKIEILR